METVTLPKELVEQLLKYLWTRPLNEAYDLFNQLSQAVHAQSGQAQAQPQQKTTPVGQYLHRDQLMNQQ